MNMIYLFLADGFEELEAIAPLDLLRRALAEIQTVSIHPGRKTVIGSHKIPVCADLLISEVSDRVDAVILPGGLGGVQNLKASGAFSALLKRYDAQGAKIGAICAAPTVLNAFGLLRGRKVTCYPTCADEITGGVYVGGKVCEDERLITSEGAGTAVEFGLKLVERWVSEEASRKIAASVCAF